MTTDQKMHKAFAMMLRAIKRCDAYAEEYWHQRWADLRLGRAF